MHKETWERPELRSVELAEVESLADLELAFTSICSLPSVDL